MFGDNETETTRLFINSIMGYKFGSRMFADIINKMGNNNYRQTRELGWWALFPPCLIVPLVETVQ